MIRVQTLVRLPAGRGGNHDRRSRRGSAQNQESGCFLSQRHLGPVHAEHTGVASGCSPHCAHPRAREEADLHQPPGVVRRKIELGQDAGLAEGKIRQGEGHGTTKRHVTPSQGEANVKESLLS